MHACNLQFLVSWLFVNIIYWTLIYFIITFPLWYTVTSLSTSLDHVKFIVKHWFELLIDISLVWWWSLSVFAVLMLNSWRRLSSRWPRLWVCVFVWIIYCRFITAVCTKRRTLISNPLSCEIKLCNFGLRVHKATPFKWLPIPSQLRFYDVLYVIYWVWLVCFLPLNHKDP